MPSMLRVRSRHGVFAPAAVMLLCGLLASCGRSDPALQTAVDSQLAVDSTTATLNLDVNVTRGVVHYQSIIESMLEGDYGIEKYFSYVVIKSPFIKYHYPIQGLFGGQ